MHSCAFSDPGGRRLRPPIPAGESTALAQRPLIPHAQAELRLRLGRHAIQHVKEPFSLEFMVRERDGYYNSVAAK